jgi:hypothetical protein
VSHRFRELTDAECLWMSEAKNCLVTNGHDPNVAAKNLSALTSRDRVRISKNWCQFHESLST